ncbi:hypothetical protein [Vreelandella sp. EE22]
MKVTCTAYDLDKLGYYKEASHDKSFPDMACLLESLVCWGISTSVIDNTKTYMPSFKTTKRSTFFADGYCDSTTKETVLVLWKEVHSVNGDIYGLSRSKRPGKGEVEKNSFNYEKFIPGFPVYFWFQPLQSRMFALEFEHSDRGKKNLDCFLTGYLNWRASPWCISEPNRKVDESNYHKEIIGYSFDGNPENVNDFYNPSVNIVLKRDADTLQKLLNARRKITRLQRTEEIEFTDDSAEERTLGERIYEDGVFKGLISKPRRLTKVKYKSEITWKPTDQELRDLYDKASSVSESEGMVNLVAITSDQDRISFFGNAVREDLELPFTETVNGFIGAHDLYSILDNNRVLFP